MKQFMYLIKDGDIEHVFSTEQARLKFLERWGRWQSEVRNRGLLGETTQLSPEGRVLTQKGIAQYKPTNGDVMWGGYGIVFANTLDDAAHLMQTCPALDAGASIEIHEAKIPAPRD